jgi:hypothetical protein
MKRTHTVTPEEKFFGIIRGVQTARNNILERDT